MNDPELRLVVSTWLGGAPALLGCLWLLFAGPYDTKVQWTVAIVVSTVWLILPLLLRRRLYGRIRALSSVLEAFREGDYSIRSRHHRGTGALAEVTRELNALGDALRSHRLEAVEASALLDHVMAAIDVVVLAVDEEGVVRLANGAAQAWLGPDMVGRSADDLGFDMLLTGPARRLVERAENIGLPSEAMELSRSRFRQGGRAHDLIVLADVRDVLRQKEREAWQRLVRVIGHEINSSLTPITSLAESLGAILADPKRPEVWMRDVTRGLEVIQRRAHGLSRFMTSYAQLAKLPPPKRCEVDVGALVRRTAALEQRVVVELVAGPSVRLLADADQIEQALLNLLRNAAEASSETGGGVVVRWEEQGAELVIRVEDEGAGLSGTDNLFVPFYTTKPEGTGIGLVLSRQVVEAHGGTLGLRNREGGSGARATMRLPLSRA